MGMSYSVYVGPFVRCYGQARKSETSTVYEDLEDRLACSVSNKEESFWVPNIRMSDRRYRFREDDTNQEDFDPVYRINKEEEIQRFLADFLYEIRVLESYYDGVYVEWGIIPKIS